jgi:hypothetical protein
MLLYEVRETVGSRVLTGILTDHVESYGSLTSGILQIEIINTVRTYYSGNWISSLALEGRTGIDVEESMKAMEKQMRRKLGI